MGEIDKAEGQRIDQILLQHEELLQALHDALSTLADQGNAEAIHLIAKTLILSLKIANEKCKQVLSIDKSNEN